MRPSVYFVGAGPGDPLLITVRGLRLLAGADVVVYDHLLPARLLRSTRPDAERIDVGATTSPSQRQEAIAYLLADKAREGKTVVRLMWGDPFVFDDGGREALYLRGQGVGFEVVPGIPAAVGAPTYAGVPVTYPDAGDVLTIVRGQDAEGQGLPRVDWDRIAKLQSTLVCYATGQQLPGILDALVSRAAWRDETAALILDGTLPGQRIVEGSLADVAAAARSVHHRLPAILVVGRVTRFREHLRWFDTRPLFGRRILLTRSREQAMELVELLEELGAQPIEAPTIRIVPPDDYGPLDDACARAGSFDWIVFTSANAVDSFMRRLLAGPGDVRELKGVRLCTIGPATADRLAHYGIKIDLTPSEYRAEAVVDALRGRSGLAGSRILLPRADIARELLAEELKAAGAAVTEVIAYRTLPDQAGDHDVYRMLLDKQIDVVIFTSASTVRNFVRFLGADAAADLLAKTIVASIGPVTAEAAQQLGIRTTVMPREYTIPALVGAIVEHFMGAGKTTEDTTA
jgi:uroporphyrinogen III methyltransferase/synthase